MTPYKFPITETELGLLRTACKEQVDAMRKKAEVSQDAEERAFYVKTESSYSALVERFERVLIADTSQDAEEDAEACDE